MPLQYNSQIIISLIQLEKQTFNWLWNFKTIYAVSNNCALVCLILIV